MGYSRAQASKARQKVGIGDAQSTPTLDGTTTTSTLRLGCVAEKVSFQCTGTITGTIEFSIDGVTFTNSTALPTAGAIATFSTHMCQVVKITRSTNSGVVTVLAK